MYYLYACNRDLFKSYYCYALFFLFFEKPFKYFEKYFYFYLYIFLKKNLLSNNYKKFFRQKFVIFNMIIDSFLTEKRETPKVT